MRLQSLFILVVLAFAAQKSLAQQNDLCSNAMAICGNQKITAYNIGSTIVCNGEDGTCGTSNVFCFGPNNTVWFKFTTNASGTASVDISNINSINSNSVLQIAVFSATTPCDHTTYDLVACNGNVTGNFSLPLAGLLPNTTYYIVVDGKGSTPPTTEASFDIQVTGAAVTPTLNVTPVNPSTCTSNDGSISATAFNGSSYSLNGGAPQSGGTFSNLTAGMYTLYIQYPNGCDTTLQVALASPTISAASAATTPSDCNQPTGTITITASGGTQPYSYTINGVTQSGDPGFENLAPGTYQVQVADASDPTCIYTFSATVEDNSPDVSIVTENTACNQPTGSVVATITGSTGPFSYQLQPMAGVQSGNTFTSLPEGSYSLVVSGNNGCQKTVDFVITKKTPVTDIQATTNGVICGSAMGSLNAGSLSGGQAPFRYSINGGSFQSSSTFTSLPAGNYLVTVQDAQGCEYQETVTVGILKPLECSAGEDQTILSGMSTQLEGMASGGTFTWVPDISTSLTPDVAPEVTQKYSLFVTTPENCTCEDDVLIKVLPKIIPVRNLFTPNGDGVNDVWEILNIELYEDVIIDIYSRWGQRVFHSEGYKKGEEWDGTNMGLPVPAANYYYVINLNTKIEGVQDIYTGALTIIR